MESNEASRRFGPVDEVMPKRSLRRRAAQGLRLSLSKPISTLFHRHGSPNDIDESYGPQQQLLPQQPAAMTELPSKAPHTPGSLRSARSLFGSLRSNKCNSTAPTMSFDDEPLADKPKRNSTSTPKSLRDRFRRTFSRHDTMHPEHSSSPIDIPTIKRNVDPLQKPIPSDLTDDSGNPLQQRMLNSPGRADICRCSPTDSTYPSPQMPQPAALSPMPGTTFPLEDVGDGRVPFEDAYDQMTHQILPSRPKFEDLRDTNDPFVDSPKLRQSQLPTSLRVPRKRSPTKPTSSPRELQVNDPENCEMVPEVAFVEDQNGTRFSDEDTLKESTLSDTSGDKQSFHVDQQKCTSNRPADSHLNTPRSSHYTGTKTRITRIKSMPDPLVTEDKFALHSGQPEPVRVVRKSVKYVNESIFFGQRSERPLISHHSVSRFPLVPKEPHLTFVTSVDCSTDSDDSSSSKKHRHDRKSKSSSDESSWLSATTVDGDDILTYGSPDGGPLRRVPHHNDRGITPEMIASTGDSLD